MQNRSHLSGGQSTAAPEVINSAAPQKPDSSLVRRSAAKSLLLRFVCKISFLRSLLFKFWLADAGYKIPHILPHLDRTRRVLDVGAGPGTVSLLLRQQGFDTVPVDIDDFSLKPAPPSRVYDGVRLPFADNSHHTALLLTVLHHTDDPKAVLQEASRVAERVVVMEDLPRNGPHRILSLVIDAFANLEFTGHACNDKTHSQWLALFDELQLEVVEVRYHWFSCFYRGTYLLKKRG